jgi:hypothetical protein
VLELDRRPLLETDDLLISRYAVHKVTQGAFHGSTTPWSG